MLYLRVLYTAKSQVKKTILPSVKMVNYYYKHDEMVFLPAFTTNMWDRNAILTPNTNLVPITKVGTLNTTRTFEDICMARARFLIDLVANTDKKLYVFWSGGLDSTAALLCLMHFASKDKLCILYTDKSLEEYPGFFESVITNSYDSVKFTMSTITQTVNSSCTNGVVVTGEIGDQIFGSIMWLNETRETLLKPWDTFNNIKSLKNIKNFVSANPRGINTVADLLWWFNYSMKYQWVQVRMLVDNNVAKLNVNMFHFFDSAEFNDYAVSTPLEEKIPELRLENYKYPMRVLISKLSNDKVYAFTKPKVASYTPIYGRFARRNIASSIDTNWERGYK